MDQVLAGRGGRLLGRSLLTLANVITAAAPVAADWNDSHIFNSRWPAHARPQPRRRAAGEIAHRHCFASVGLAPRRTAPGTVYPPRHTQ
jgi:hypothetical protein